MKRQLTIMLLLFSICGQGFIRTAWVLHYQWNRAAYLRHCENLNRPALHCDGKCYLKKKIVDADDKNPKEPRLPASLQAIKEVQLFFEQPELLAELTHTQSRRQPLPPYQALRPDAPPREVFRPPARV